MRSIAAMAFVLLSLAVSPNLSGRQTRAEGVSLIGAWEKRGQDASTHVYILLILRSDGTYRKTLDAVVDGVRYGGTHVGRWTAKGTVVYLSGDAKWPPYSHDLSEFQKKPSPDGGKELRP